MGHPVWKSVTKVRTAGTAKRTLPVGVLLTAIVVIAVGCGQASAPILPTVSLVATPANIATPDNVNVSPIGTPTDLPMELRVTTIWELPTPDLGVVVDKGMRVVDIEPEYAIAKAGVVVGDVLVAVDDVPFTRVDEAKKTIRSKTYGDKVKIKLNRGGKNMEIEVALLIPDFSQRPHEPGKPIPTGTPVWPPYDYF